MEMPRSAASRWRRPAQLVLTVVIAVLPAWWAASPRAFAQVPNPAPQEPPGGGLMSQILGWLKWGALWAAVAGLLIGAIAVGVGHFGSNYGASSAGRKWLLGGIGSAAIAGLAWTFATTVYSSTG
jgi:hypothetical protein